MKGLIILVLFCFAYSIGNAQNYVTNGGFEFGLNTNWEHQLLSGALASFEIDQSESVMEGSIGLKVHVEQIITGDRGIQSSTGFIAGSDSIYLLRFWARGLERSKMYVEVEGSETPGVLYEMHRGRTLFHLPFKTTRKNIQIHFYYQNPDVIYNLDGVEVLDQNNKEGIDVLNTYNWQHNRSGQGWTAGDNDISILLPDGRTLWFFNDSFYGTNDVTKNPLYDVGSFIRNAMVVQELDGTLNTRPFVNQHGQKVYFEVPEPMYKNDGSIKNFFWVGDAIIEDGKIKVHLIEVKEIDGGVEDTGNPHLAVFSYPELEFLGLDKQATFCQGYESFFIDNDSIYLYKSEGVGYWERYSHVARTKLGNLNGKDPWEYWNGTNWIADESESVRINDMGADKFIKLDEGNYAHVSMPNLSNMIQVSFAPNPEGPWTQKETVYTIPNDSAYWFYMPNFHSQLPNGNYSISYSVNSWYKLFFAFEAFVDKFWYRQRYIQVDLLGLSPYTVVKDCAGVLNGNAYLDECDQCVGGTTGQEPCVTGIAKLYSDCDFSGNAIGLEVGDYSLTTLETFGFSNNDLSSIEVKEGYLVELFDGDNFTGDNLLVNASNNCLDAVTFSNKATSLIVRRVGTSDLSGIYAIQNKQSSLYLSVENQSIKNNALIEQTAFIGNNSQRFDLHYSGKGYYQLINVASNMAFNTVNYSKLPYAKIEQWDGLDLNITNLEGSISAQYSDSPETEGADKLIDNLNSTKFLTFQHRAWVQFHSQTPHIISRYSITSANDTDTRDPRNWSLLGSLDGKNWTMLDIQSNIDFTSRLQEKSFSIENSHAYSFYRLDMVCDFGEVLQLAQWKLFASYSISYPFDSQLFTVQDAGGGYFRMINKYSDKVLGILEDDNTEGSYVRQMPDTQQPGALWKLQDTNTIATDIRIVDQHDEPELIIYPNPVDNTLSLKLSKEWLESDISIIDITGVRVWSGSFKDKPLHLDKFKTGFYFIKISNGNKTKTGRFIKR